MAYPPAVEALINALTRLPGIGVKTAERLALHLVRAPISQATELAQALTRLGGEVTACSLCRNLTGRDPCPICADEGRDTGLLCVVESPADLAAMEASGQYQGRYFVLAGALSPLEGVGPDELRLGDLTKLVSSQKVREVIIATNPTVEGEATAQLLAQALESTGAAVSRLGYGMPVGGDLKYMDGLTLSRSLDSRQKIE